MIAFWYPQTKKIDNFPKKKKKSFKFQGKFPSLSSNGDSTRMFSRNSPFGYRTKSFEEKWLQEKEFSVNESRKVWNLFISSSDFYRCCLSFSLSTSPSTAFLPSLLPTSLAYKWGKYQTEKVFINQVYHASLPFVAGFWKIYFCCELRMRNGRKVSRFFFSWSRLFTLSQMYFNFCLNPPLGVAKWLPVAKTISMMNFAHILSGFCQFLASVLWTDWFAWEVWEISNI